MRRSALSPEPRRLSARTRPPPTDCETRCLTSNVSTSSTSDGSATAMSARPLARLDRPELARRIRAHTRRCASRSRAAAPLAPRARARAVARARPKSPDPARSPGCRCRSRPRRRARRTGRPAGRPTPTCRLLRGQVTSVAPRAASRPSAGVRQLHAVHGQQRGSQHAACRSRYSTGPHPGGVQPSSQAPRSSSSRRHGPLPVAEELHLLRRLRKVHARARARTLSSSSADAPGRAAGDTEYGACARQADAHASVADAASRSRARGLVDDAVGVRGA